MTLAFDIAYANTNRLELGAPHLYILPDTLTFDHPSALAHLQGSIRLQHHPYPPYILVWIRRIEGPKGLITLRSTHTNQLYWEIY